MSQGRQDYDRMNTHRSSQFQGVTRTVSWAHRGLDSVLYQEVTFLLTSKN